MKHIKCFEAFNSISFEQLYYIISEFDNQIKDIKNSITDVDRLNSVISKLQQRKKSVLLSQFDFDIESTDTQYKILDSINSDANYIVSNIYSSYQNKLKDIAEETLKYSASIKKLLNNNNYIDASKFTNEIINITSKAYDAKFHNINAGFKVLYSIISNK